MGGTCLLLSLDDHDQIKSIMNVKGENIAKSNLAEGVRGVIRVLGKGMVFHLDNQHISCWISHK